MMDLIWAALVLAALAFGAARGELAAVSAAALEGAGAALRLCLELGGAVCLWSGVMKVMERAGLSARLARLLRPLLRRLYPSAAGDEPLLSALAENLSANLLGLGNAATPAGIRAAERLAERGPVRDAASDELCRLAVMNSASVQLLPTTVCALRAAAGAERPFDILPAVWLTSLCALAAGLGAAALLARRGRRA